jgi:site-specific DNA-methyltransferase (adenine-specific)
MTNEADASAVERRAQAHRGEAAAVWVELDKLTPWGRNPRVNDGKPVEAVMESIRRFGFGAPILARLADGEVIAGHTRLKAAHALGLTKVPVRYLDLDPADAHLLALADNRIGEFAEWDDSALLELIAGYPAADVALAGWDAGALAELANSAGQGGEVIEDDAPEPPANPITKPGDVWTLGRHRLVCGDCTDEAVVALAMGSARAVCVVTDPPYGVAIAAKNRAINEQHPGKGGRNKTDIEDDALSPEELKARLLPAFVLLRTRAMAEDCTLYVTSPHGGELGMMMMMMMQEARLAARHVLIWKKNHATFSMGRLDYDYQHEPILMTWGKRHKRVLLGKHRTSIWEIDKPRRSAEHPTMKPVELYANAYLNSSERGDVVADIYAGSGTAFAAAEQLERVCNGIEISPAYCDVIVERWQNLTGGKATRA